MTDEPKTSEQPSGHLRWVPKWGSLPGDSKTLQQLWYITTYRGLEVEQREEWRDVPVVNEPMSQTMHKEVMETARGIAARWRLSTPEKAGLAHEIALALMKERERAGGAAATRFNGNLILCHPDMPAHVWDGEKMEAITFEVLPSW